MYRLFIDPGSTSTGWAVFKDEKLLLSDTISSKSKDVMERIGDIFNGYYDLILSPLNHSILRKIINEIHIESINIPNNRAIAYSMRPLLFSVGAIAAAFSRLGMDVKEDISVPGWKSYTNWNKTKNRTGLREKLRKYKNKVSSEDELAAIGMGLWYLNKLKEKK